MSKLIVPNSIIIIGATLYIDGVQFNYLQREYPYIITASTIKRFPRLDEHSLAKTVEIIKNLQSHSAIFILAKYYDKLLSHIEKLENISINYKENGVIATINNYSLRIKKIAPFNKLAESVYKSPINKFKVFGKEEELQRLEDELEKHAIIVKVLPTWYHLKIEDSIGEKILIEYAKKSSIKILPIPSVTAALIKYLKAKNKTISFAESCTGGLLSFKLTKKAGASDVFNGSIVSYSNEIKKQWLGVKEETLKQYGAVSKECVAEMLLGIEKKANADIAVAISGIAGPSGATENKDVGTVFIGVKNKEQTTIQEHHFCGDRNFIQEQAARKAIEMILYLEKDFFEFF